MHTFFYIFLQKRIFLLFSEIRDTRILEILQNSEDEDFVPSDEDVDPTFSLENGHESDSTNSDSSDSGPVDVSSINNNSRRRGRPSRPNMPSPNGASNGDWVVKNFTLVNYAILRPSYLPIIQNIVTKLALLTPYIDDTLIETILVQTNRTSVARQGRSINITNRELYIYIGITFIMGALNFPSLRMYWEMKWRVPVIADNMSRNRFLLIRNSIKMVFDEDISDAIRSKDKLWKVRPLIDQIQKGCRKQEKEQRLSLDEMIIPFSGSCGIRQFCPGKPNPVGLKAFVLANPNGLVVDFHIYEGSTTYPELEGHDLYNCEKAVISLVDSLVPGHIIYFDRYFTTVRLAKQLASKGIGCTGTIQKNRIPAEARPLLSDDRELKRQGRGSVSCVVNDKDGIVITKWLDNKGVTMLSTVEGKEPIDVCRRWCKRTKQYVNVERPVAIRNYNKFMGGVDQADRMLAVCPNRYRTKKWTQRFFSHMLDLAVSNAWLEFKQNEINKGHHAKKIQQLRYFKMELGETLLDMYSDLGNDNARNSSTSPEPRPEKRPRGKPSAPIPSKKRRTEGAKHMPSINEKQSRCRHCHNNFTRTKCTSCNISLCLTKDRNCYMLFHQ